MAHNGAKQMPAITARMNSSRNWCIPVSFKHYTTQAYTAPSSTLTAEIQFEQHIQI